MSNRRRVPAWPINDLIGYGEFLGLLNPERDRIVTNLYPKRQRQRGCFRVPNGRSGICPLEERQKVVVVDNGFDDPYSCRVMEVYLTVAANPPRQ